MWWNALPEVTKIAIWEDLFDICEILNEAKFTIEILISFICCREFITDND